MTNRCLLLLLGLLTMIVAGNLKAQERLLTIDSCYTLARMNYPLIKQLDLIKKTRDLTIENIGKANMPQLNLNGQLTYQSAVTSIGKIPGFNFTIPTLSKTQYNVHAEVDQTLYDGGLVKQQQQLQTVNAGMQEQNIEVQLYALKDRINQIYFGILLTDRQQVQNLLVQKDLQNSIDKMQVSVDNGAVLKSNLYELQAELLQQQQNEIVLNTSRKSYMDMLQLFINRTLGEKTRLLEPAAIVITDSISRPELNYYEWQKKSDDAQEKILDVTNRPKLLYFLQGGYGLPGLNGFDVNAELFYITGVRLSWSLGGFYTLKNQKHLLKLDRQGVDIQKENFLLNTHIVLKQQSNDITKLQQMIGKDNEIIVKRTAIKDAAKAQADNGVITVHEYINQLDAEDQAKQSLMLHQIQLMLNEYNYQNISGN